MAMQEHESKEFSWLLNEPFVQRCAKKHQDVMDAALSENT